jgi:DNA primase
MVEKATTRVAPRRVPMPSNFQRFAFIRERLPHPADFYAGEGIKLLGTGGWRNALCPSHNDTKPSMRVFVETGAFRCMVCGAKGGDVLAFHMLRHGLRFIDAAKALGAWGVVR